MSQCRNTHPVYGRCELETGHKAVHTSGTTTSSLGSVGPEHVWYTSDGYEPSETDEPFVVCSLHGILHAAQFTCLLCRADGVEAPQITHRQYQKLLQSREPDRPNPA